MPTGVARTWSFDSTLCMPRKVYIFLPSGCMVHFVRHAVSQHSYRDLHALGIWCFMSTAVLNEINRHVMHWRLLVAEVA